MKETYKEELNKTKKIIKEKTKEVYKFKHRMKKIGKIRRILDSLGIDTFRYYLNDDYYMTPLSTGAIAIRNINSPVDVVFSPRTFHIKPTYYYINKERGAVPLKYYNTLIDNFDIFEKAFYDTAHNEFKKINDKSSERV